MARWKSGQADYHFRIQKLDYIHNNPVEEMVVSEPHHYLFSSAMNYAGKNGLINVELIF